MENMGIYEKLSFQLGHFVYHDDESTRAVLVLLLNTRGVKNI